MDNELECMFFYWSLVPIPGITSDIDCEFFNPIIDFFCLYLKFILSLQIKEYNVKAMVMNATISMDGLWSIVDSLSVKNKKWLVDKLSQSLSAAKVSKEDEILTGISRSITEAKNGITLPLDSIWEQL